MRKMISLHSIILLGFALMLTNSCKKDNNSNPTEQIPILTTTALSNITQTAASCGGNITSDGGEAVTARGVCWSTNQNPTIADSKTIDGVGAGSFTSNITRLTAGTIYYVRSYATNNAGTGYGNKLSFTTSSGFVSQLRIVSILPDKGGFDTEVTIYGIGFSAIISENIVTINNAVCKVILADTSQLKIIVPKGCGSGTVSVNVKGILAIGPNFTYQPTPVTTTLAGNSAGYLDGNGTNALLFNPGYLLSISDGSFVISDNGNGLIRNLEENGTVSTLQAKKYSYITGMALANMHLFVADGYSKDGMFVDGIQIQFWPYVDTRYYPIVNFATGNDGYLYGIGTYPSGNNGETSSGLTRFNYTTHETTPYLKYTGTFDGYISVAGANNILDLQIDNAKDIIYFLDASNVQGLSYSRLSIRKITNYSKSNAIVTTLFDLSTSPYGKITSGDVKNVNFYGVGSFYVENDNKIYLASNGVIRKIEDNMVTIVGGDFYLGTNSDLLGYSDGKNTISRFNGIMDIVQDANKNLIVSDNGNNRIRKISFE